MDKSQWFAEVLRTYEKRVLRYALKKVPKDLAQEFVQESFLRLWREDFARLEGREGPWLFSVARNLCLDWLKGEGKRKTESLEDSHAVTEESPMLNKLLQQEEENQVLNMVASLNENQQEVLRLKFQEGFSYKEISEITGHSVSHVGVLIHEALVKVRQGVKR